MKSFQAAIERQPKNMVGYNALADFYLRKKNHDEALQVIRAGLREEPDNFATAYGFSRRFRPERRLRGCYRRI